jgi:hypothetical protein
MNLYVIGWNLPKERYPTALAELRRMTEVYPRLDSETLWHRSTTCGTLFMAAMHTADQAAAPRNYVMQNDGQVVLYSGLPVNPTGDYPAHRAGPKPYLHTGTNLPKTSDSGLERGYPTGRMSGSVVNVREKRHGT